MNIKHDMIGKEVGMIEDMSIAVWELVSMHIKRKKLFLLLNLICCLLLNQVQIFFKISIDLNTRNSLLCL